VVCEYDAPHIDGPAVLDAVGDTTPFIAVFDAGDGRREVTALENGAARTLRRPRDARQWPQVLLSTVRDAVEQRRLVEHSGDAEKRYRSLFENNPLIIWEEDYSASKRRLDEGDLLASARTAEWTLVENTATGERELYHRAGDPDHQRDLSGPFRVDVIGRLMAGDLGLRLG
jgi:PAS domain-containing protein